MLRVYITRTAWTRALPWSVHILLVVLPIFIAGLLLAFSLSFTKYSQEAVIWSIFGVTFFLMMFVGGALYPMKYKIFSGKIRIYLGGIPPHFDIPFSNIENVSSATFQDLWGLNLNFINSYSSDDILRITRKHGAKIHITPDNRTLFLDHLNKALADWRRSTSKVGS